MDARIARCASNCAAIASVGSVGSVGFAVCSDLQAIWVARKLLTCRERGFTL
jgi:hypothetical protein